MSPNELERVSSDLTTIRQAMRLEKRYAWDDIRAELATALGGLLAILLLFSTQLDQRVAFMLAMIPSLLYCWWNSAQRRRNRADQPALWHEDKLTLQAMAIVLPFIIGWLAWSRLTGTIDIRSAGAASLFFFGIGLGYVGITDTNRRKYLAGGICLMAFGLAMPSVDPRQLVVCAAVVLIVAGLAQAAIVSWQLKRGDTITGSTDKLQ